MATKTKTTKKDKPLEPRLVEPRKALLDLGFEPQTAFEDKPSYGNRTIVNVYIHPVTLKKALLVYSKNSFYDVVAWDIYIPTTDSNSTVAAIEGLKKYAGWV